VRFGQDVVDVQAKGNRGIAATGNLILVKYPEYGTMLRSKRLEIAVQTVVTDPVRSTEDYSVCFEALGVASLTLPPSTEIIETKVDSLDPGSLFFSVSTADKEGSRSAPSHGYIEYVLPDEEIRRHRRFASDDERRASAAVPVLKRESAMNVCFFGADILDGQRSIWLAQSQHMGGVGGPTFTWILGKHAEEGKAGFDVRSSVRHRLRGLEHVRVLDSPGFEVDARELSDVPGDGRPAASAVWGNDVGRLFQYAHESLLAYDYNIDAVQPAWCRRIYQRMRAALRDAGRPCGVVVYGNTRMEDNEVGGDVVITDTARALDIPTVAELMNLFVSAHILPTVIVAPSQYALEHDSVRFVLAGRGMAQISDKALVDGTRALPPAGVVISPAVDTDKFDPARYYSANGARTEAVYRHPTCAVQGQAAIPCTVVGFVARLAPGMNSILIFLFG
jgi:hypothetical protein